VNLEQLLHSPQAKPIAAVGGIGAVVLLALHARSKAKAGGATSSGSYVSAIPPANQPVVQDADVLGQALAGLRGATGSLQDAANQLTQATPPAGTGSSSTTPAVQPVGVGFGADANGFVPTAPRTPTPQQAPTATAWTPRYDAGGGFYKAV
jgi:hypothetical protein